MAATLRIEKALPALGAIQKALTVTVDGTVYKINRVYDYPLPANRKVQDLPCWVNTWSFGGDLDKGLGSGKLNYEIHSQLYVGEAIPNTGQWAEVATYLHSAFVDALRLDLRLSGTTNLPVDLRGGDPTLAILNHANTDYVGLDYRIDLRMWERATFG